MIYPDNFESKIKFDRIRQLIKSHCQSEMGKELTEKMQFSDQADYIRRQQEETGEFMRILQEEEFPGNTYADARPFLNKIRIEALSLILPCLETMASRRCST